MKRVILTLVIAFIGFTVSHAQDSTKVSRARKAKYTAEQRAEMASSGMQQKLGLTNDQKEKVYQLELDRIKKMDEWRGQDKNAMKDKMEERKAFMKESKDKLDQILTPEQKAKFESLRKEQKDKFKDKKPGMHRQGPMKPVVSDPPKQG